MGFIGILIVFIGGVQEMQVLFGVRQAGVYGHAQLISVISGVSMFYMLIMIWSILVKRVQEMIGFLIA